MTGPKLLFLALAATLTSCTQSIEKQVDILYEKMNWEERYAQLKGLYMTQFFDENLQLDTALCREKIPNGVGHISQYAFNTFQDPDDVRDMVCQLQTWLVENTPSGIPALFHEELLTGVNTRGATIYPQQIGLACSFNPELAEQKTWYSATGLRRIGGALALSPMVDVCRDPSFNRLEESYGEDGYLSAAMGTAFVRGLQHGDLKEGVAACTKHFPGYGGGGNAPEKELIEEILLPHEAIIRTAGSRVVMPGYHQFHGQECCASKEALDDILRGYLGFEGVVVSDYSAISKVQGGLSPLEQAVAAINAGNDVDLPHGANYALLPEAVEKGLVSEKTIETAVKRVLRLKVELGLLDNPMFFDKGHIELDSPEERELAYRLATQSVVLLKNEGGILPLDKPMKIALTGPNAGSMWAMLGDYTYPAMIYFWKRRIPDAENPHIVTLREGMEKGLPEGGSLLYSRGCDWTEKIETVINSSGDPAVAYLIKNQKRMVDSGEIADRAEALRYAAQSDVIIAAMGENVMLCGENRDRGSLRLPGSQELFVEELIATGKPVVLVVFGGRAQVISELEKKCAAVIQAWYPGEEGGNALADILYGKVSPSGKLSVSYPSEEIVGRNICYSYGKSGEPIAHPFGFGLSYSSFEYSDLSLQGSAATSDKTLELSFKLRNSGEVPADEIAQIYICPAEEGQQLSPIRLQGFARVSLEAGEQKSVTVRLGLEQFGYYDADKLWSIDPGKYTVKVGASSEDIRLEGTVCLEGERKSAPRREMYLSETIIK